jgi:hypothetical protein
MTVVQRIRFHAQRYLESEFLSSVVFVRLAGAKWIRPGGTIRRDFNWRGGQNDLSCAD